MTDDRTAPMGAYVTCEASVCDGSCRCHYVTDHHEPCGLGLDGNECRRPTGHSGTCYDEATHVAFEDGWWADDRGNGSGCPPGSERQTFSRDEVRKALAEADSSGYQRGRNEALMEAIGLAERRGREGDREAPATAVRELSGGVP